MAIKRGFAAMTPERRAEIAKRGGESAHAMGRAHQFTSETARSAGRKGGESVASRPGYMAKIGRKGGAAIAKDAEHMRAIGRLGGSTKRRAG
jgi:uncharacterized protein